MDHHTPKQQKII